MKWRTSWIPTWRSKDQKWSFVNGAADSENANANILKSISTGLNLGIDNDDQIKFGNDDAPPIHRSRSRIRQGFELDALSMAALFYQRRIGGYL